MAPLILIFLLLLVLSSYGETPITPAESMGPLGKQPLKSIAPDSLPSDLMLYFGYPYTFYYYSKENSGKNYTEINQIMKENLVLNFPQFAMNSIAIERLDLGQEEEDSIFIGVDGKKRYSILMQIHKSAFESTGSVYGYLAEDENASGYLGDVHSLSPRNGTVHMNLKTRGGIDELKLEAFYHDESQANKRIQILKIEAAGGYIETIPNYRFFFDCFIFYFLLAVILGVFAHMIVQTDRYEKELNNRINIDDQLSKFSKICSLTGGWITLLMNNITGVFVTLLIENGVRVNPSEYSNNPALKYVDVPMLFLLIIVGLIFSVIAIFIVLLQIDGKSTEIVKNVSISLTVCIFFVSLAIIFIPSRQQLLFVLNHPTLYFFISSAYWVNIIANIIARKTAGIHPLSMILYSVIIGYYPVSAYGMSRWNETFTPSWCLKLFLLNLAQIGILTIQMVFGSLFFLPNKFRRHSYDRFIRYIKRNPSHRRNNLAGNLGMNDLDGPELEYIDDKYRYKQLDANTYLLLPGRHKFHPNGIMKKIQQKQEGPHCGAGLPKLKFLD